MTRRQKMLTNYDIFEDIYRKQMDLADTYLLFNYERLVL